MHAHCVRSAREAQTVHRHTRRFVRYERAHGVVRVRVGTTIHFAAVRAEENFQEKNMSEIKIQDKKTSELVVKWEMLFPEM